MPRLSGAADRGRCGPRPLAGPRKPVGPEAEAAKGPDETESPPPSGGTVRGPYGNTRAAPAPGTTWTSHGTPESRDRRWRTEGAREPTGQRSQQGPQLAGLCPKLKMPKSSPRSSVSMGDRWPHVGQRGARTVLSVASVKEPNRPSEGGMETDMLVSIGIKRGHWGWRCVLKLRK